MGEHRRSFVLGCCRQRRFFEANKFSIGVPIGIFTAKSLHTGEFARQHASARIFRAIEAECLSGRAVIVYLQSYRPRRPFTIPFLPSSMPFRGGGLRNREIVTCQT